MGGKSSKGNDNSKTVAQQTRGKGHPESQPYNRRDMPSQHRRDTRSTPPTPAWSPPSQEPSTTRIREQRHKEGNKTFESSWGKTSFNTFDLHSYSKPSSQSHNDLSNKENYEKFSNFRNITSQRDERERERKRAQEETLKYNFRNITNKRDERDRDKEKAKDETLQNKSKFPVSSPKKSLSKYNSPPRSRRRNSLPLDDKPQPTPFKGKGKSNSRSSPQKKKLSVTHNRSAERKISDISTIALSDNTTPSISAFKSTNQNTNYSYGGNKSFMAAAAVYGKSSNNYNAKNSKVAATPKVHPEPIRNNTNYNQNKNQINGRYNNNERKLSPIEAQRSDRIVSRSVVSNDSSRTKRQAGAYSRVNSLTLGSR